MAASLYRAWRFTHPDFDLAAGRLGLGISGTGGIEMVDGEASVRQAILLLLSTRRGERVMRPDYGCELHRLVFAPNDATTHGLAIHYVRRALERWEPRIDIRRIDAGAEPTAPERMFVSLDYRVRTTLRPGQLTITLNLMEGEA